MTEISCTRQHYFDQFRTELPTRNGPVSCVDTGGPGTPVLFLHGVGTSSYLWRNVFAELDGDRRCVAVDFPLHGRTPAEPNQDFTLPAMAGFVADCCDAIGADRVDLVANDTGGAVAQVFAAANPDRLTSLALTNCEAHDNIPPTAFLPTVLLARAGMLARTGPRLLADVDRARRLVYGAGYQDVEAIPEEIVRANLTPLIGTPDAARQFQRFLTSLRSRDLLAVESDLTRLTVPTVIIWGTGDIFFRRKWAYWLRDTIPGASRVVEIAGGKLFFPDERARELAAALRRHWARPA
ncbi:alpha/beta fold hydrolase [Cryptosporangium aurantiacum]|nr:alpha/beta hydrolase [Cryptosporangium aurantiacum]